MVVKKTSTGEFLTIIQNVSLVAWMIMTSQQFRLLSVCLLLLTSSVAFGASKIVDGGAGTDSLTINYSGISSLGDFAITTSGDYLVLTDSSSNTVNFKNISSLKVGSYDLYSSLLLAEIDHLVMAVQLNSRHGGTLLKRNYIYMVVLQFHIIFGRQIIQDQQKMF